MTQPNPQTLIARQAVAQMYRGQSAQRIADILAGKYDFCDDMIVAEATVKLTLELSDRTPRNPQSLSSMRVGWHAPEEK